MSRSTRAILKERALREREFYYLRSLLGYSWAMFFLLLGGRQAGKSYSVMKFFLQQWKEFGRTFYWLRLKPKQCEKLLKNNAAEFIDPDLRREFGLNDLVVITPNVYVVTRRSEPDKNGKTRVLEKKLLATVLPISTFYDDKGIGYFDKDYDDWYNIGVDEFQRELNEKNTFDIMYALVNQLENLVRNTKCKLRVFFLGNTLQEASDVLCSFNFIPEKYGRYTLVKNKELLCKFLDELKACKTDSEKTQVYKKYKGINFGKRAVIDYIEPSDAYQTMREGSIADILMPEASTFSNKIDTDYSLIYRGRVTTPIYIIKFGKTRDRWFTMWDSGVIKRYNGEHKPVIAMRRYLDEVYDDEAVKNVIRRFDYRGYQYRNLITFKLFQKEVELLKPNRS